MRTHLILVSLALSTPVLAQTLEDRLTPSNPIQSDILGYDVAMDAGRILAGAPFGTYDGVTQPGRAFIFELENGNWNQAQELRPPVPQEDAWFGADVALDGDTLICAASGEDVDSSNDGAVYVFEHDGASWSQVAKLTASDADAGARFGYDVAISGQTIAVGAAAANTSDGDFAGAVYIFDRIGGVWTETQKLTASNGDFADTFGSAVAIDGDRLVIGARGDNDDLHEDSGAAYVFERTAGVWTETAILTPAAPQPETYFGEVVAIEATTIVVGAERFDHSGANDAGAAFVFELQGATWTQTAELTTEIPADADRFGCGVSISGSTIVVGAHLANEGSRVGTADTFRKDGTGTWQHDSLLTASDDGNTNFGWRVALDGDRAAIAGPFYQTNRGAIYTFTGLAPCLANWNNDEFINTSDIAAFLNDYNAVRTGGDWTNNNPDLRAPFGIVNTADVIEFINIYNIGCD